MVMCEIMEDFFVYYRELHSHTSVGTRCANVRDILYTFPMLIKKKERDIYREKEITKNNFTCLLIT